MCLKEHDTVIDLEEIVPYAFWTRSKRKRVLPPVCEKWKHWTVGLRTFLVKRAADLQMDQYPEVRYNN